MKGSKGLIREWVNNRQNDLNRELLNEIGISEKASNVEWLSPLADDYKEYRDGKFLEVLLNCSSITPKALQEFKIALKKFWPSGGSIWDGLARITNNGKITFLLIEAKSHKGELTSNCKSGQGSKLENKEKADTNRNLIDGSLNETKIWLNIKSPADWTKKYYQYANRIAHLYFLREKCKLDAFLANIYFLKDPSWATDCFKDQTGVDDDILKYLGLSRGTLKNNHVVSIFLPVCSE